MKKTVDFHRSIILAALTLLPCIGQAQNDNMMSFSEDETAKPQAGATTDNTSTDTETSNEVGASAGGAAESDLLSALGESGASASATTSVKPGEETPKLEVTHPIWAVQQVYALRKGRLDFQPSFGISMNDPYVQHQSVSVAAAYYITEVLGIGASFNFYGFLGAETDTNYSVSRATHQIIPINEYLLGAQINFTYVPMYGKFAFFGDWILHWDVWVIGGGGLIMTRPIPVIDPEYRSFDYAAKFSFNVGLGGRLYLTRFLAILLEVRDYIFPEQLESLTSYSVPEQRSDKNNWLQDGYNLTNNVTLHAGVTMFFPFTFEYKLPK